MQYETEPFIRYFVDGEYTSKAVKYLVKGQEFLLKESFIELEDNLLGLIDEPENLYFLQWVKGNEFYKKANVDAANSEHAEMLLYWNFLLEREGIAYYRIRYNLLMIFEKVGGLMSCITVAMFYLMKPCYYKKHAMAVLREYEKKGLCRDINHATVCNQLPLNISPFRLFLYDVK